MRKSYDLKSLKVKRLGVPSALRGKQPSQAEVRVSVTMDKELVKKMKTDLLRDRAFIREVARQVARG
jgi:hypothetical protein